ncbi:MAG: TetR/AcrR family transcriptional regulator [Acidimicrobiia bacterium]
MSPTNDLRSDAVRNREALLEAAREVFAEMGLNAPLDEIARRAGIGNATLYRRFPTRADLVHAVFAERMREHLDAVAEALEIADPWDGFVAFVHALCLMQVRDRGIADLVTMDLSTAPEIERSRSEALQGLHELAERAQDAGALRLDFTPEDVVVILMANAGLVRNAHEAGPKASARLVHLLLDGLRSASATDGPRPPSRQVMRRAMRRQSEELRLGPAD